MTKCDFCLDHLEQGLSPACVTACPMRVLDYSDGSLPERGLPLWEMPAETHPYPLPNHSHTQPRLVILPHPGMNRIEKKVVANLEEVRPRPPSRWEDLPLILFTLLGQLAVGSFWSITWMFFPLWNPLEKESAWLRLLPLAFIGTSLGVGLLASFAHLGTKKNAWRVLSHWRKSSLSREILFSGLFAMGWLFTTLVSLLRPDVTFEAMAATAILGVGLIYNMSQVYRLPAIPAWDTWRTNAGFMVSTLLLGQSAMAVLLVYEAGILGIQLPSSHWFTAGSSILVLLLVQVFLTRQQPIRSQYRDIRLGLILAGMVLTAATVLFTHSVGAWVSLAVFLVVVMEEGIGRWLFYRSRT
jgi:DMSO reductase anchor subunit